MVRAGAALYLSTSDASFSTISATHLRCMHRVSVAAQVTLTVLALYAADAIVKFMNVAAEKARQVRHSIAGAVHSALSPIAADEPACQQHHAGLDRKVFSPDRPSVMRVCVP